jgi:hypothetical protein
VQTTPVTRTPLKAILLSAAAVFISAQLPAAEVGQALERGFVQPPDVAKPHAYWLWLNGHVDLPSATRELRAMKESGISGVLLFEMGMRGDTRAKPPAGPAFLSAPWVEQLRSVLAVTKAEGLQTDMSVISSWDLGGPWVEPRHATMAIYSTEQTVVGGGPVDTVLPFPHAEAIAPRGADGRPAFWTDVAVLAVREPRRLPGHSFVIQLDPEQVHALRRIELDNGVTKAAAGLAETMTPVRTFAVSVATEGTERHDFKEVFRGELSAEPGTQAFELPEGTRARYVRLDLLSAHDAIRPRWTLAEFRVFDDGGTNVAGSRAIHVTRNGARLLRSPVPLAFRDWNAVNVINGETSGPTGVFASAGLPAFDLVKGTEVVDVTGRVDREGRLKWNAPPGSWTLLRYVCMITGERLKIPSPASDGLATDHLNPAATRLHMNHVISQLRQGLGDLRQSGLTHLYLASYEVVGRVWSPEFGREFERRRGYSISPFLPAIFGARMEDERMTERFLFDYQKTLGEVLVDAYYRTAREVAHAAGLTIKSEAGGPGPPIHTPPVDALLANGAVDAIQGEFWPHWSEMDAIWVVKETASAGHIYGKPVVHMEAFTSFHHWADGPQDLKASADRVFCEGGNHFVWHTWTHQPPGAGLPGWAYHAGTHLNRNDIWWPQAGPFLQYLARGSFLLQRGRFVADVLYYYGDGGGSFVGPRRNPATLGPGYDYDVTNADVILNRLEVKNGRLLLPDGMTYAVLVLPEREEIHPAVLEKIDTLVRAGATVIGPKPTRATGLEGFPASDQRVRTSADALWAGLDGTQYQSRAHGRGWVHWGVPEKDVLLRLGIVPDFKATESLDFTHRNDSGVDIYFVRNKGDSAVRASAVFRVRDRAPEFWDPITGKIERAAAYRKTEAGMTLPLDLAPRGSIFVVFRDPLAPGGGLSLVKGDAVLASDASGPVLRTEANGTYAVMHPDGRTRTLKVEDLPRPLELSADWSVQFESPVGAPEAVTLRRVAAWSSLSSDRHRYFSGTGAYRRTFSLPSGWLKPDRRAELDLGSLWTIAEVQVNGRSLGISWTPPFRVDCTDVLRAGENEIVVKVANTWHNRLVGDARLDIPGVTQTNITVSQGKLWHDGAWRQLEPIQSGLMGPVRLVPVAREPIRSSTSH